MGEINLFNKLEDQQTNFENDVIGSTAIYPRNFTRYALGLIGRNTIQSTKKLLEAVHNRFKDLNTKLCEHNFFELTSFNTTNVSADSTVSVPKNLQNAIETGILSNNYIQFGICISILGIILYQFYTTNKKNR